MSLLTEMEELLEKYDRVSHKKSDSNDTYLLKSIVNYFIPRTPKKSIGAKWDKMSPAKRVKLLKKVGARGDLQSLSNMRYRELGSQAKLLK